MALATNARASSLVLRRGAKPPSSPTLVASPASLSSFFSVWKTLGARAQRLGEAVEAHGVDHELLDLEPVVRVRAAVDDVHHGGGQHARLRAAEVTPERQAQASDAARAVAMDTEDGVGAELALGGRAVQLEQRLVHGRLVERVHADDLGAQLVMTLSTAFSTPLPK
jgi:hypothetical protein